MVNRIIYQDYASPPPLPSFDIEVPQGGLVLDSVVAGLSINQTVTVPQGNLALSTTAPTALINENKQIPQADLALSAVALDLLVNFARGPPQGDLVLSTAAPTVESTAGASDTEFAGVKIAQEEPTREVAPFIVVGDYARGIAPSFSIEVPAGDLVLSTTTPVPLSGLGISPPQGDLTLSTVAANQALGIAGTQGDIVLSTVAGTALVNVNADTGQGDLALSTTAPTALVDVSAATGQGDLVLSTVAATALINVSANTGQGDLVLSTLAPVVQRGSEVPQGDLTLSTTAPAAQINVNADTPQGDLTLSTTAAAQDVGIQSVQGDLALSTASSPIDVGISGVQGNLVLSTAAPGVANSGDTSYDIPVPQGTLTLSTAAPVVEATVGGSDTEFAGAFMQFGEPEEFKLQYIPVPDDPSRAQARIVYRPIEGIDRFVGGTNLEISSAAPSIEVSDVSAAEFSSTAVERVELAREVAPYVVAGHFGYGTKADALEIIIPQADVTLSSAAPTITQFIGAPPAVDLVLSTTAPLVVQANTNVIVPVANLTLSTAAPNQVGEFKGAAFVLDTTHADYSTVIAALSDVTTEAAAHDANLVVVNCAATGARTGDLAPLHRDNLATAGTNSGDFGVLCDEYVDQADYDKRSPGVLGSGAYAGQIWYIRPAVTWDTSHNRTRHTSYGTGSGLTFRDALSGTLGYTAKTGSMSGPCIWYIVDEHILDDELIRDDGWHIVNDTSMGIYESGTADNYSEVRHDYPGYTRNGVTIDRGVIYGSIAYGRHKGWSNLVVKTRYTSTIAFAPDDIGRRITLTTDGDTGIIAMYDGAFIWIQTDGSPDNTFDSASEDSYTVLGSSASGSLSDLTSSFIDTNLWTYNGFRVQYTATTPLVAGDIGKVITSNVTGHTGTIADYDDTWIYIWSDRLAHGGAVDVGRGDVNHFNNESGNAFTITGGTGVGSFSAVAGRSS
jgi:hypothetical protein